MMMNIFIFYISSLIVYHLSLIFVHFLLQLNSTRCKLTQQMMMMMTRNIFICFYIFQYDYICFYLHNMLFISFYTYLYMFLYVFLYVFLYIPESKNYNDDELCWYAQESRLWDMFIPDLCLYLFRTMFPLVFNIPLWNISMACWIFSPPAIFPVLLQYFRSMYAICIHGGWVPPSNALG